MYDLILEDKNHMVLYVFTTSEDIIYAVHALKYVQYLFYLLLNQIQCILVFKGYAFQTECTATLCFVLFLRMSSCFTVVVIVVFYSQEKRAN